MSLAFILCTSLSFAGEVDILVKKLVEKGLITQQEANDMLSETKAEENKDYEEKKQAVVAEVKDEIAKSQDKLKDTILPSWIKNTTFSGDMRLRYAFDKMEDFDPSTRAEINSPDRHRGRFRLRYGFETTVNDKVKVGFRLASGTGEQVSTNQTMQDTFSQKNIWIDRAYLEVKPIPELRFAGGKIENPFYTTDLLWDPDITPEGVVVQAKKTFGEKDFNIEPFVTAGFFPIDESSTDSNDVSLYGLQGGISAALFGTKLKFAGGYYDFHNIKGAALEDVSPTVVKKTNTVITDADGKNRFAYDYRLFTLTGEFTPIEFSIGEMKIPVTFYGDYVTNTVSNVKNETGSLGGIRIGSIKNSGDFQISYDYRRLEKDAIYEPIADSDFHGGGTNSKGSKYQANYALFKNTTLGVTFFDADGANQSYKKVKTLFVDMVVKF